MALFPLSSWPAGERAQVQGVLTDIDDTLTTDGAITPDALGALAQLKAAGWPVFAITGRPAGWSEPFALAWPVDAIVAENGAVALSRGADGQLVKRYLQSAGERRLNYQKLRAVARTILQTMPHARLSTDSQGRETDIAIDHSECAHLDPNDIERVRTLMRTAGLHATVSSIHINGWIGDHDKLVGARWAVRAHLNRDVHAERHRWVYVGDSTNDARMFEHFPHSVGVANVARFVDHLSHLPRHITLGARGAGFSEVVTALLEVR